MGETSMGSDEPALQLRPRLTPEGVPWGEKGHALRSRRQWGREGGTLGQGVDSADLW